MGKKVLFVSQEIAPFVSESPLATMGKTIPHLLQDGGYEIRTFHPKWGNINERRNQLHEVIRLSGMNIIIDETDHPLLIKVAALPQTKTQTYFIDNEDFFFKRLAACDKDGVEYNDNYERAVFYGRSVLETVKKLRWYPEVIICQGWISAVVPFLVKTVYKDEPAFNGTKIISIAHSLDITKPMPERFPHFLTFRNVDINEVNGYGMTFSEPLDMMRLALRFSDAAVTTNDADQSVIDYAQQLNLPTGTYNCEADKEENATQLNNLVEQLQTECSAL